MVNYNGRLLPSDEVKITPSNRAFNYGDGVFETVKIRNGRLVFWEEHYFRLMASMRMIRMKIPVEFTLEFLENEILKTIASLDIQTNLRARLSVFRKDGGLYMPTSNDVDFLVVVTPMSHVIKEEYHVDLYKDFFIHSGYLSTIKSTNKLIYTLASIYAQEHALDNCILLNERKGVVEVTNANIFLVKDSLVKTPSLSEGCLNGIIRAKVIDMLSKNDSYTIDESIVRPFEIQKADEIFITNCLMGIQPVTKYRKKGFKTDLARKLQSHLKVMEVTSGGQLR